MRNFEIQADALVFPGIHVLMDIYRRSLMIMMCDERIRATIRSGRLVAPYYSPRGQEVIAAAVAANLRDDDQIVTIYRGIHEHLAKGVPLRELWAEYAGRKTGACGGKGGPMHITHPERGVMVTTGIVGSGLPIANGLGLAFQVRGESRVVVASFGDGAANIGAFHESLNLAALWKLPVIFLCQNNRYAEHTRFEDGTSVDCIAKRGESYSMPSMRLDGNDAIQMWNAARIAVERARAGDGPTLIEAVTFRFEGHNYGDPGNYIPREEYDEAKRNDPVPRLRNLVLAQGVKEEELDGIQSSISGEIDDAIEFAFGSPDPVDNDLMTDVYAEAVH